MGAGMSSLHKVNHGSISRQICDVKKLNGIANMNDFSSASLNALLGAMGNSTRLTESFVSEYHQAVQLLVNCLNRLTNPDIDAFDRHGGDQAWRQRVQTAVAASLGVRAQVCRNSFNRLVSDPIVRMMRLLDMGIRMPRGKLKATVDTMLKIEHIRSAIFYLLV